LATVAVLEKEHQVPHSQLVAALGGATQPMLGVLHLVAIPQQEAEVVHRRDVAALGGATQPMLGVLHLVAIPQQEAEVVHRRDVAALGGATQPMLGVLHLVAIPQQEAEVVHRRDVAALGGATQPMLGVLHLVAIPQQEAEVVHRRDVAALGGATNRLRSLLEHVLRCAEVLDVGDKPLVGRLGLKVVEHLNAVVWRCGHHVTYLGRCFARNASHIPYIDRKLASLSVASRTSANWLRSSRSTDSTPMVSGLPSEATTRFRGNAKIA